MSKSGCTVIRFLIKEEKHLSAWNTARNQWYNNTFALKKSMIYKFQWFSKGDSLLKILFQGGMLIQLVYKTSKKSNNSQWNLQPRTEYPTWSR